MQLQACSSGQKTYDVEGAKGAPATQHESCAAEGVARLPQEVQLVLKGHVWTIIGGHAFQVLLYLLDVLPDGLRHCGEVLVQLTAVTQSDLSRSRDPERVWALHEHPEGIDSPTYIRVLQLSLKAAFIFCWTCKMPRRDRKVACQNIFCLELLSQHPKDNQLTLLISCMHGSSVR